MAKGGINLNIQVNSAVAALRQLDGMLKKLDSTMGSMKGMSPEVTKRMAELEGQISSLSSQGEQVSRVGQAAQGKGEMKLPAKYKKVADAEARSFIGNVGQVKEKTKALGEQVEAIVRVDQAYKNLTRATEENKKAVITSTAERQKANGEFLKSVKQKQNLGIPLLREEQARIRELNAHVRDASKNRRQLTDDERRLASALKLTGKSVKISSGILQKHTNVLEQLRLTVSRTRNITLLYAFAVRPMQQLIEGIA